MDGQQSVQDANTLFEELLTEIELQDRLAGAVAKDDLLDCLCWVRKLEQRGELKRINDGHSETGIPPLVAVASKETPNRTRNLMLRCLRAKGAKLPVGDECDIWAKLLQPWAIQLVEMEANSADQDERDAMYLLSADDLEVQRWIYFNLAQPAGTNQQFDQYRSKSLAATASSPSPMNPPHLDEDLDISFVGSKTTSSTRTGPLYPSSAFAKRKAIKKEKRELTLPPVENVGPSEGPVIIDLTESRSPSPVPKAEPEDAALKGATPPLPSSPAQEKGKGRATDTEAPDTRAHLRVDNLPGQYAIVDLRRLFEELPGVVECSIEDRIADVAWGMVAFRSLLSAQHAFAAKKGKVPPGGTKPLELKVYSSDGRPVDPHVEVQPVTVANGGTYQYSTGFTGGGGAGMEGGMGGGGGSWNRYGGGQVGNSGFHLEPRYFPRPRVPHLFTAAELARRVYVGGLPYGISDDEVGRIITERAAVMVRVLKVKQSPDGTHAFAFVQHPDSITADHAIKVLHGTVYEGHLLQLEHVNELAHRWVFSLALRGLPGHWQYRDVSDFLISTIGSFAGLRVDPSRSSREINVRVELRYETELRWAAQELDGLLVVDRPIVAVIEQAHIRRKVEREQAYDRLQREVLSPVHHTPAGRGYDPSRPDGASPAYDLRYPAMRYKADVPPLANGGETTSNANGKRLPPPPPPPPPAKRPRDERSTSPRRGSESAGAGGSVQIDDTYNPFAPKWMFGGGSK
ncbi:hypothetical protein JCM21900_003906 [Sporobolomyces salmonicolor]